MQISFLSQLIKRLQSDSPAFFKKLQVIAFILVVLINLFNWLVSHAMINVPNSKIWTDMLNYVGGTLTGLFLGSLLPTTDPNLIGPDVKKAVKEDENIK